MGGDKLALIAGVCVFTAALCRLFDSGGREYAVLIKTAAAAVIMTSVISALSPAVMTVTELFSRTGSEGRYLEILMRSLGICYLTGLAADICRDSGEGTLATQMETAGKLALLLISLPLFEQAAQLAVKLIGG